MNPATLLEEALRVTSAGGRVLFSTFSDALWPERLAWFEAQAAEELVGEIDYAATHTREIVCRDGFRSGTLSVSEFSKHCSQFGLQPMVAEVDQSSVFFEVTSQGAV